MFHMFYCRDARSFSPTRNKERKRQALMNKLKTNIIHPRSTMPSPLNKRRSWKRCRMKGDINHSRNTTKQHSIPGLNSFHTKLWHSKWVTQLTKQTTPREMVTTQPTTMPMGIATTQPLSDNRTTSDDQYSVSALTLGKD